MVPEVEVRVLGPVAVQGAARPFGRSGALDLVVYLALHPGGCANDVWATALWPERAMAPPTLHSTVSVARRALGRSRAGSDHLPRAHGKLALAPTVTTDWERFRSLARSRRPGDAEQALLLVRGRPFDGLRSSDWTLFEGLGAEIEAEVGRLAAEVGGRALERGRPEEARAAARRGLLASPYDERLFRLLMRAADAEGNPAGVRAAMSELVGLLGGARPGSGGLGVGPELEEVALIVHPETFLLYRTLLGRPHPEGPRRFPREPPPATGVAVATL